MAYGNMFGGQPNNNLWVGNNYSTSTNQMPKMNYSTMNSNNNMAIPFNSQFQSQSINNILQVMGPESAQAYRIGPDSQVILMDSNNPVFYWKRSDSSGYSETKAFEFHEIPLFRNTGQHKEEKEESQEIQFSDSSQYVTKSEFEDFKKMIEDLVMKNE